MKYLYILLLVLCTQFSVAQETLLRVAAPTEFKVTGPASGDVSKPVSLVISGLPAVDLSKPLGEQTLWVETIRFELSSPSAERPILDKELSMSVSPWEWRLRINFTPKSPGTYLLVCDWNQTPYGLALHRVEIGGTVTPPFPPPVIPDDPVPAPTETTGTAYLVIIRHNAELTADQTAELLKLRQWSDAQPQIISHLEISPDAGSEDDRLAGYIAKAGPLPWVVLSRGRKDGKGAIILWSGPFDSAKALQTKFEEVVK